MQKIKIMTANAPSPLGHYSQALRVGEIIFTSGQTGIIPGTHDLAGQDIETQTRQAIENLRQVLIEAGSDLDHVVKSTVFLRDMADFAAMNRIYAGFFSEAAPARSTVQVNLGMDAKVEIEMIAFASGYIQPYHTPVTEEPSASGVFEGAELS
jgi:2-iminobutanoate/2-iminopropanoate deaminase